MRRGGGVGDVLVFCTGEKTEQFQKNNQQSQVKLLALANEQEASFKKKQGKTPFLSLWRKKNWEKKPESLICDFEYRD